MGMDCSLTQPTDLHQESPRDGHLVSVVFRSGTEQRCCFFPTLALPGWTMAIIKMDSKLPSSDGLESLVLAHIELSLRHRPAGFRSCLFGPKSLYRLDRGGAVCGNGRCYEDEETNRKRCQHNDDWVERINCKQLRA
jgi:hypothetical protein